MMALPHPTQNPGKSRPPETPTLPAVAAIPDFGRSSRRAGTMTSAKMNESMPSSAQPPHEAQNPRTWLGVSATLDGDGMEVDKATHCTKGAHRLQAFPLRRNRVRETRAMICLGRRQTNGYPRTGRRDYVCGANDAAGEPERDRRRVSGRAQGAGYCAGC